MKSLEVVGPFRGTSGHDRHTREFVRHFVNQGCKVQLTALNNWSHPLPGEKLDPWFEELIKPIETNLSLHFSMPNRCQPRRGKRNVNYTMFEADRIPADWALRAAEHDRIIVPTECCAQAWMNSGVSRDKLRVTPLAVDGQYFEKRVEPMQLTTDDGRAVHSFTYRFLNIAELRPRKNHLGLLRAWLKGTKKDDDAVLVLKCTAMPAHAWFTFGTDVMEMTAKHGLSFANAAPVVFLNRMLTDEEMRSLYQSATHYISMSHGEGWDLPMMESAASGLELIAPKHSAYEMYLGDGDVHFIPASLVPATVEGKTGAEDRIFFEGVNWWKPDEAAAAGVVANIVNGSASKVSPKQRLINEYTWENAARKLLAAMDDLI